MRIDELFSVRNKHVVVTGGSRGIGRMIAEGFVRNGAHVLVTARKANQVSEAVNDLTEAGVCDGYAADVADETSRRALVDYALARYEGRIDVLVNNAGSSWGAPLEDYPVAGWHKVTDVNLIGLFELTRLLLPALRSSADADPPARVINIGSVDGIKVPMWNNYAYAASKAGVHMLTRQLARQLGGDKITVNAVAPGPFRTKMTERSHDEFADEIAASVPLGRVGEPEDMAGTTLFLASRAGAYLSGAIIPVDGGTQA